MVSVGDGPARSGSMGEWWTVTDAWCSAFDSRMVPEG
jgi:hypothetical protein